MYYIADIAAKHTLTEAGRWRPLGDMTDADLVTMVTEAEAIAFCRGYSKCGHHARPMYFIFEKPTKECAP